jgi:hypothetical protein
MNVDPVLGKLMGSSEKAESRYVKIADYIIANNIGREVLMATLESSGLSFSSVNTEKAESGD